MRMSSAELMDVALEYIGRRCGLKKESFCETCLSKSDGQMIVWLTDLEADHHRGMYPDHNVRDSRAS